MTRAIALLFSLLVACGGGASAAPAPEESSPRPVRTDPAPETTAPPVRIADPGPPPEEGEAPITAGQLADPPPVEPPTTSSR